MSNLYTLEKAFQIFLAMQCNFSYEVAGHVFYGDSDHFWTKWVRTERNIINFLSSLDNLNRRRMIEWGVTLIP
jgi:hypothetical protein